VSRLCEFALAFAFTTEEKARKNLSQGKKNLKVQYTFFKWVILVVCIKII
jgi:hypothetical protein